VGNSSIIKPLVTSQVKTKQPRHGTILSGFFAKLWDQKLGLGLSHFETFEPLFPSEWEEETSLEQNVQSPDMAQFSKHS
jgi:hypothetical protein